MEVLKLNRMPEPTWSWLKVNTVERTKAPLESTSTKRTGADLPHGVEAVLVDRDTVAGHPLVGRLFISDKKPLSEEMFTGRTEKVWCVRIADDIKSDQIIDLDLIPDGCSQTDEVVVFAGKRSSSTVRLAYKKGNSPALYNNVWLIADEGSSLTFMQANLLSPSTEMFGHIFAYCAKESFVQIYDAQLGGDNVTDGIHVILDGDQSNLDVRLLYAGSGEKEIDLTSYVEHRGKETGALVTAKGILDGKCRKTFRDTLDFIKGSSKSKGREEENVLMLSPTVKNVSVPLLYCGEDDVEGEHAASCGRPDESVLYYFMSRGISEEEARKMMAQSSFASMLADMPDEALCESIMEMITKVLFEEKEVG